MILKKVWTGSLTLYEQEGGYAAPDLNIDEHSIARELWDLMEETYKQDRDHLSDWRLKAPGKWRLTLENDGSELK